MYTQILSCAKAGVDLIQMSAETACDCVDSRIERLVLGALLTDEFRSLYFDDLLISPNGRLISLSEPIVDSSSDPSPSSEDLSAAPRLSHPNSAVLGGGGGLGFESGARPLIASLGGGGGRRFSRGGGGGLPSLRAAPPPPMSSRAMTESLSALAHGATRLWTDVSLRFSTLLACSSGAATMPASSSLLDDLRAAKALLSCCALPLRLGFAPGCSVGFAPSCSALSRAIIAPFDSKSLGWEPHRRAADGIELCVVNTEKTEKRAPCWRGARLRAKQPCAVGEFIELNGD